MAAHLIVRHKRLPPVSDSANTDRHELVVGMQHAQVALSMSEYGPRARRGSIRVRMAIEGENLGESVRCPSYRVVTKGRLFPRMAGPNLFLTSDPHSSLTHKKTRCLRVQKLESRHIARALSEGRLKTFTWRRLKCRHRSLAYCALNMRSEVRAIARIDSALCEADCRQSPGDVCALHSTV